MGRGKKDDYEADFMGGDSALFREKHVSRLFSALMSLPALLGVAAGAVGVAVDPATGLAAGAAGAAIAVGSGALVAGIGIYFAVMRTTVTAEEVSVQYGTLGPRIEVAAITKCEIVELEGVARWMVGPKIWPEGWRYIPPGVRSGVRITWQGAKGETTCTIGASDAAGLAAAIEGAWARALDSPRVRVSAEAEADEDGEEEELEAAGAGENGERREEA